MATLYAWSPIQVGDKTIALGETVSAGDVGGKEELENLRASGVVRPNKFPEDVGAGETPREARLRQLRAELEAVDSSPEAVAEMELAAEAANPAPVEEVEKK